MLAPTLALLVAFFIVPIGVAAYESFFSWDMLTRPQYVGLENYRALAAHGALLATILRTLGYSVLVVAGAMSWGLALALLLDRPGRVFAFVRASVFSAYVVSWVAVALLWMWMLDGDDGLVSRLLRVLGRLLHVAGATPGSVLGDPSWALSALALVAAWKLTGYAMVVFLAGLRAIPPSLGEAAALDGARAWARFRHVTWPLLGPTAAFVATTLLVTSFQAFDLIRITTQGGPAHATEIFVYAIYEQIFLDLRVGRASALTVIFFGLLLVLAGLQLRAWRARAGSGHVA